MAVETSLGWVGARWRRPLLPGTLLVVALMVPLRAHAGAAVVSAASDGTKITLTLHVPGGDLDTVRVYRLESGAGFWTRLKANLVLDENGEWIAVGPTPTADPNRFLFDDTDVHLAAEYCYVSSITGHVTPDEGVCVIHQPAGENLQFPAAPTDVRISQINVHSLTLKFQDTASNETQFMIERRFPTAPWQAITVLPQQVGSGTRATYRDRDVEMSTRYCYRVTASNPDGARPSTAICARTEDVVVPSVTPPEEGAGVVSHISHHRTNGLAVAFVFARVDFDRNFTVSLFQQDNLDGNPERSVTQRIRSDWPHLHSGVFFEDLDPTQVYCAKIETDEASSSRRLMLCESPFGKRTQAEHLGPSADELPVIAEVLPGSQHLRLVVKNARPGLLIDMVQATTGIRRTQLDGAEGQSDFVISAIVGTYCLRPFVMNAYGSRYGNFVCATALGTSGGGSSGGVGGSSGGGGVAGLKPGVDCDCTLTGEYEDSVAPAGGLASSDGVYRVELTSSSVFVFRNSNNVRVFNQTALAPGFTFGFGPRTRFFVLNEPQGNNLQALAVHDLERPAATQRVFLDTGILGDENDAGFSPDGRTFVLARMIATQQLGISLVNLELATSKPITFQRPFSGFFQFSPCGDVFATGIGPGPIATPFVSLFRTVDGSSIKTGFNLPGDFSGIASTDTDHVINRGASSPVSIVSNSAPKECSTDGSVTHNLVVVRYDGVSLSDAAAATILADAGEILQVDDGPSDVACDVTFKRFGGVQSFSTGDGSIDSESELDIILAEPGNAKAVDQLNFCAGVGPALGCAEQPGTSFVFVRGLDEHITVAHEFGHNKGLDHRDDDFDNVMHSSGGPDSHNVNATECAAFLQPGFFAAQFQEPERVPLDAGDEVIDAAVQPPIPIEDFVRRRYFEGVPYDRARLYGEEVLPTLLRMLSDPRESRAWSNIVVVLGMVGDARAISPLIAFIERDLPAPDRDQYRAKTSAIMSLGYLVHLTGNTAALEYLRASTTPDAWRDRRIDGRAPYQSDDDTRNDDFSKSAVLGLAVAGTPEARAILEGLRQPGATPSERRFRDAQAALIAEAIRENLRVNELGLAEYYRR